MDKATDAKNSETDGGEEKGRDVEGKAEVGEGAGGESLGEDDMAQLSTWMKEALKDRVSEVHGTDRLVDSPAIISDHDNAVTRRMLQVQPSQPEAPSPETET